MKMWVLYYCNKLIICVFGQKHPLIFRFIEYSLRKRPQAKDRTRFKAKQPYRKWSPTGKEQALYKANCDTGILDSVYYSPSILHKVAPLKVHFYEAPCVNIASRALISPYCALKFLRVPPA